MNGLSILQIKIRDREELENSKGWPDRLSRRN
jgi:hypothetical protein